MASVAVASRLEAGEHITRAEQAAEVAEPLMKPLRLLNALPRLDHRHAGARRKKVGQVGVSRGTGLGGQRRQVDRLEFRDASLGDRVKGPQRLDLVAVEFHPHGAIPVGGEEIDDPAAAGERAGGVDGVGRLPATSGEPLGEFLGVRRAADREPPSAGFDGPGIDQGREDRLDARHDDRRRLTAGQGEPFDDGQPLGLHGVVGAWLLPPEILDCREQEGRHVGEQREIIHKGLGLGGVGQDDGERAGGAIDRAGPQDGRRCQCAGRSPGSADRAAMPFAKGGDDFGEPAVLFEGVGEAGEPRTSLVAGAGHWSPSIGQRLLPPGFGGDATRAKVRFQHPDQGLESAADPRGRDLPPGAPRIPRSPDAHGSALPRPLPHGEREPPVRQPGIPDGRRGARRE
jgi:hypothetical protein